MLLQQLLYFILKFQLFPVWFVLKKKKKKIPIDRRFSIPDIFVNWDSSLRYHLEELHNVYSLSELTLWWKQKQTECESYLLSGVVTEAFELRGCAVEFIHHRLDLSELVLYHVQTENSIQFSIVLLFQHLYILLQLWQTPVQTQQQTFQPEGLQGQQRRSAWTLRYKPKHDLVGSLTFWGLIRLLQVDALSCIILSLSWGKGFSELMNSHTQLSCVLI